MPLTRFKLSSIADGGISTAKLADGAVTLTKTDSLFVNTEISGTEAAKMPVGTTAQRTGAKSGDIRFNSTISLMEYYDGVQWKAVDSPPIITSVSGFINEDTDTTLVITGSNFATGATVSFLNNSDSSVIKNAATVTRDSNNQLTVTTGNDSSGMTAGTVIDVLVTNPSGLTSTSTNVATVSADPLWLAPASNQNLYIPTASATSTDEIVKFTAYDSQTSDSANTDPYWEDVVLLIQPTDTDTSIDDKSSFSTSVVNSNNTLSTSTANDAWGQSPYYKTIYFNGSNADMRCDAAANLLFKSAAWTIEWWMFHNGSNPIRVFSINDAADYTGNGGSDGWDNVIIFNYNNTGPNMISIDNEATTWNTATPNTWHHHVMQWDGNELTLWQDGTQVDSKSWQRWLPWHEKLNALQRETLTNSKAPVKLTFGAEWDDVAGSPNDFGEMYIQAVRMTRNVARYQGISYTVPTSPFPTSGTSSDDSIQFSVTSGTLPSGLTLNSDGTLVGKAATVSSSSTSTVTITAQKGSDTSAATTRTFNIIRPKNSWGYHPETPWGGSMQDLIDEIGDIRSRVIYFTCSNSNIGATYNGTRVIGYYYDSGVNSIKIPMGPNNIGARYSGDNQYQAWLDGNYAYNNSGAYTKYAEGAHNTSHINVRSDGSIDNQGAPGVNNGAGFVYFDIGIPFRYVSCTAEWRSDGSTGSGTTNADWGANAGGWPNFTQGSQSQSDYGDQPFEIFPQGTGNEFKALSGNTTAFSSYIASGGWTASEKGDTTISVTYNEQDLGSGAARTVLGHGIAGGSNENYKLNYSNWFVR